MVEDIVKPALDQEAAISEFATYLDIRTHGRLGDDVLPLARLLRHSMLVDALELLSHPWFKDSDPGGLVYDSQGLQTIH
jgi:hypothetical protein